MILVLDTETSGLLRPDLPAEDASQPHLLQLGLKLFPPAGGPPAASFSCLIKPDGWSVEPEAFAVHGIDEARAIRGGIDARIALIVLQAFAAKAMTIVAHHVEFDRKIIAAQLAKLGANGDWWKRCGPKFSCTMERATPICKIPGEFGYKFPTLEEAHEHFYPGLEFKAQHDAEADVGACAAIYWALERTRISP